MFAFLALQSALNLPTTKGAHLGAINQSPGEAGMDLADLSLSEMDVMEDAGDLDALDAYAYALAQQSEELDTTPARPDLAQTQAQPEGSGELRGVIQLIAAAGSAAGAGEFASLGFAATDYDLAKKAWNN